MYCAPYIYVSSLSMKVKIRQLKKKKKVVKALAMKYRILVGKTKVVYVTSTAMPNAPKAIDSNVTSFFEMTWRSSFYF